MSSASDGVSLAFCVVPAERLKPRTDLDGVDPLRISRPPRRLRRRKLGLKPDLSSPFAPTVAAQDRSARVSVSQWDSFKSVRLGELGSQFPPRISPVLMSTRRTRHSWTRDLLTVRRSRHDSTATCSCRNQAYLRPQTYSRRMDEVKPGRRSVSGDPGDQQRLSAAAPSPDSSGPSSPRNTGPQSADLVFSPHQHQILIVRLARRPHT